MKIYLVRHWETEENISWIIQWHLPWKLSENWIKQVNLLAGRLQNEKFDYVFTSDLARALDTTKAILKFHTNIPIKNTLLRERYFWDLQWINLKNLWLDNIWYRRLIEENQTCETIQEVTQRCEKFVEELRLISNDSSVLVVCHSWIWRWIIWVLKWEKDLSKIDRLYNASLSIFEYEEKWTRQILINCTKHLYKN